MKLKKHSEKQFDMNAHDEQKNTVKICFKQARKRVIFDKNLPYLYIGGFIRFFGDEKFRNKNENFFAFFSCTYYFYYII